MTFAILSAAKVEAAARISMTKQDDLALTEKIGRGPGYARLATIVALAGAAMGHTCEMAISVEDFTLLAPGWDG